jgi:Na+/H+ antiporter NhaC
MALGPLFAVIALMLGGFWFVGQGLPRLLENGWDSFTPEAIGNTLDNAYNMQVAVVASGLGSLLALFMARARGLLTIPEALRAWLVGFRSLLLAIAILFSAWALAGVCQELLAGDYLGAILGESIRLEWYPILIFLLACCVAFATGTSWGTMAILLPISIPIVYQAESGLGPLTLLSLGAVLEGAIFGDHCSPISDTTVLSSVAAGSDHIDHVRTQIPYALTTMALAIFVGYLPVAFGLYSAWVAIPLGGLAGVLVLLFFGKRLDDDAPREAAA